MKKSLDNRVLDWVGRWRFSTRALICHSLQSVYGSHNALIKRLIDKELVRSLSVDKFTLFSLTSSGLQYARERNAVDYPGIPSTAVRPTRSFYHDLFTQYVTACLMDQGERFAVFDRFESSPMLSISSQYTPDAVVTVSDRFVLEVELHSKSKRRVYHRFLHQCHLLDNGRIDRAVFVFRNARTRDGYAMLLSQNEWPVYIKNDKRSLVQSGVYEPDPDLIRKFDLMTIEEIDGRPNNEERVK